MNRKNEAVNTFNSGKNCAQSVLLSYSDELKIDKILAENLTSGFGAGMGKLHKTCGALTGSFMVIGRYNSIHIDDEDTRSKKTTELIQFMESEFTHEFGSSECGLIINADLNTELGQAKFRDENIKANICSKCVEACVSLLEKNL